jgi:phage/plasmid-associated DNA primase
VLLSVLAALLGQHNVAAVQPSQFDNRFQRAHLHGKLANIVTEIAEGAELADAALKAIVSGELTTAEHKHKPPFDFQPFATCWFGTNHMPHSRDFSDALFRRAIVLTFNRKFYGTDRDEGLKEKLFAELPGIC